MGRYPLLTRREVGERLHVSESTLDRLARSGAITKIRVGKRAVRFDPLTVDAYLARARVPAAAPLGEVEALIREGTRGPSRRAVA